MICDWIRCPPAGGAGEQVALHQSGRTSTMGQAEERPVGRRPVQTANQAASEERLGGVARRSEDIDVFVC